MKLIKVSMELIVDHDCNGDKHLISMMLNDKLYNDPEFYGEFGPENIDSISDWED